MIREYLYSLAEGRDISGMMLFYCNLFGFFKYMGCGHGQSSIIPCNLIAVLLFLRKCSPAFVYLTVSFIRCKPNLFVFNSFDTAGVLTDAGRDPPLFLTGPFHILLHIHDRMVQGTHCVNCCLLLLVRGKSSSQDI